MAYQRTEVEIAEGKTVVFETGKLAKQAHGSCTVRQGDTLALVTACIGPDVQKDFFPLTVEYREKAYASGRIPGSYPKRESRPSEKETLSARIIDRPLRPLFPNHIRREIQVVAQVLSADEKFDSDVLAMSAASLAVGLSCIPFADQVAAVRVALCDGKYVVNPEYTERDGASLDMIVAGSETSIVMVEGNAYEVSEEEIVQGILTGHEAVKKLVAAQKAMIAQAAPVKLEFPPLPVDADLKAKVEALVLDGLRASFSKPTAKKEHYAEMEVLHKSVRTALDAQYPERGAEIDRYYGDVEKREMREAIFTRSIRIDGRRTDEVRPIMIETGLLPRAHGSALFQRGETQALVTTTLGTRLDEQHVESLLGETYKNYFLHYNFPNFSVGETGRFGNPGRREIGHGHLAEKSLEPIMPTHESFGFTLRLVSDILESNGSSSMATVCGGSLALMDAGVPVKSAVAGIAMGLITDGNRTQVLTDILGTEDHLGDMDFKVAGTGEGVTAFQMDIKVKGLSMEIMRQALEQARTGRLHILAKMNEALKAPRELSKYAPTIIKRKIPVDRIKELIGPGGKMIRGIQTSTGANIEVEDSGDVTISAPRKGQAVKAAQIVDSLFEEPEIGKTYKGVVKSITSFGAFCAIMSGQEGLVHISEFGIPRGQNLDTVLKMNEELDVVCKNIDHQGKIRLALLNPPPRQG